jgi:RNA polymerase sigma-70 factor (ECF subfamily)
MYVDPTTNTGSGGGGRFQTTRWSVITSFADGSGDETQAREALSYLCRTYWRPIFAFISHHGHTEADAQDLTQEFFLMMLKGRFFRQADRTRGRFRSFLRAALKNFLSDARIRFGAEKRGGKVNFVAWDDWMAEAPSHFAMPAKALERWTPEQIFDARWAATLAEQALRRLQEECEMRGRRRVFDTLSPMLTADRDEISYELLGRELSLGSEEIKRLLHQLRRRYRALLRAEVAQTVQSKSEIEDELRYLISALGPSVA